MAETKAQPAWLTSAVDQRLAAMHEKMPAGVLRHFDIIQTPLTNPEDDSDAEYQRWDNSCDHCQKFVGSQIVCRTAEAELHTIPVVFLVGACPACWELP